MNVDSMSKRMTRASLPSIILGLGRFPGGGGVSWKFPGDDIFSPDYIPTPVEARGSQRAVEGSLSGMGGHEMGSFAFALEPTFCAS